MAKGQKISHSVFMLTWIAIFRSRGFKNPNGVLQTTMTTTMTKFAAKHIRGDALYFNRQPRQSGSGTRCAAA